MRTAHLEPRRALDMPAGDVLILAGENASLDAAESYLLTGTQPSAVQAERTAA